MFHAAARFNRNKKVSLILTPLLDMFTIILVFLMVSFQAEDKDFILNPTLKLPISSAQSPFKTAVNVAISKQAVIVEGQPVYQLEDGGRIKHRDLRRPCIDAIADAVARSWEGRKKPKDEENVVVVQADKDLPYKTIYTVVRSATYRGFYRFRLVVEKE